MSRIPKIITNQPGYDPESNNEYIVSRTKTRGYRLYCLIDGVPMDASLQDVPGLRPYSGKRYSASVTNKTDYIQVRVSPGEKAEIEQAAKKEGLDTMSSYLLMLHRKRKY